jgi:hypothetical protein
MAFKPTFNEKTGTIKVLVRLSYANRFFDKTASVEGGSLKYRTNGLMSKTTEEGIASIKAVNQAIRHIVEKEWPGKDVKKFVGALKDRAPLFDGDEYTDDEGNVREHYEGVKYLKLTNDKRPKYKDRRGQDLEIEEAKELFISGYWAIAYLHLYTIKDKAKGGNGIFATLDAIQFVKRDEQFSGGGIDDEEIDDLGDDEDGMDDLNDDSSSKKSSKRSSSIDDDEDDELGI